MHQFFFLNAALEFPCRGNKNYAIGMCDSAVQWSFEKLGDGSDAKCVSKETAATCTIQSAKYNGACSGAPSANCPNDLAALINAWIELRRLLQK